MRIEYQPENAPGRRPHGGGHPNKGDTDEVDEVVEVRALVIVTRTVTEMQPLAALATVITEP